MDIIYEIVTTGSASDDVTVSSTPGELFISRPSEELRIKVHLRMQSGEFFLRFKQQLAAGNTSSSQDTYFGQMCKQLDLFIDSIFQVDDTLAKMTCPRLPSSRKSDPRIPLPPNGIRRQQSQEISSMSRGHSLNKISEDSTTSMAQSHSMESLLSSSPSSGAASPPYTPRVTSSGDPTSSLLKEVIPKNVAHWHRWFTVRNLFVLNDVTGELVESGKRVRHGMTTQLLVTGREKLIQALREFAHEEFDSGRKFFVNLSKLDCPQIQLLMTNSHVSNILCRSNDVLVSRMLGDARYGTVTDTINPFAVIDVSTTVTNSSEAPYGVVVLNLGLYGLCPSMERLFVDILSNRVGERSVLLDAPSPIFRSIAAGLLKSVHVKKQPVARSNTTVAPTTTVGMGAGESFYTYSPEPSMVNKFMLYYAWETVCPSASVMTDLLTKIHEERIKDGWKCIHEAPNGLTYVEFTERPSRRDTGVVPTELAGDLSRLWVPMGLERQVDEPKPSADKIVSVEVAVDWGDKFTEKPSESERCSRKSVKGMCVCLHVQYVQPRAEKPYLKCQIWIDRGHPAWRTTSRDDLIKFAHSLCDFEQT